MCFGGASVPEVKKAKPIPTENSAEVEAAAAKERQLAQLRKGRQSTILTPLTNNGQQKTLLGQ